MRALAVLALVTACLGLACQSGESPSRELPPSFQSDDGVAIAYHAAGLENEGPAIFFVHGWSNNWTFAQPRFDRFAVGHPVVAIDLPGFGSSGTDRSRWSIEAYASDVRAVVEGLGLDDVVLVGHSMGGAVVLAAAPQLPERVRGVVTVDWLQDPNTTYDDQFVETYRANYQLAFRDPGLMRANGFSPDSPAENVQRYISNMPSNVPEHWWTILRAAFEWASDRLVPTLESIEVPILAINTDQVPTNSEAYDALVPSFDVVVLPGRGHIGILWEDEATFDSHVLAFVERVAGT